MCGIVGYIGPRDAYPIIINGLKRLEYRGYDSAGIGFITENGIEVYKKKGRVKDLEDLFIDKKLLSHIALGHTRWATHGDPSDKNAHPQRSASGRLAMVHNGIIENYGELKSELLNKGYSFSGDTDTEILINYIEDISISNHVDTEEALRIALQKISGNYVVSILDANHPDTILAARKGNPLVIGIGHGEYFLGSDATPMIEFTKDVVYVEDYQIATINKDGLVVKNLNNEPQSFKVSNLNMELMSIEKGGYPHFMLKEIFEQPATIADCFSGRLNISDGRIKMKGLDENIERFVAAKRFVIIACGTSWHAGLLAEYIIEDLCRIPVEVEYSSEFRYRNPIINKDDVVIAISQSGETADTLMAIQKAKEAQSFVFGIVNVVGSSISRSSDAGAYTHAGSEIGVASTKAFTAQLVVLLMIALKVAVRKKTITKEKFIRLIEELDSVPRKIEDILRHAADIKSIAEKYEWADNALYLGRGYNFPIALEGALKLKEISYIHAEGYPAAEMKHGPIALVNNKLPIIFVATSDKYYQKILSNIQEIKARKGQIVAVISEGDNSIPPEVNDVIVVPKADEMISPLLAVVPLQLFAYYIGVKKGYDVDKPRNLAKSVTVE